MAKAYNRALINESQINKNNGPGAYRPEDAMKMYRERGASISGRADNLDKNTVPGVGTYNIGRQDTLHGGTMGKRYDGFMNMYKQGSETPGAG